MCGIAGIFHRRGDPVSIVGLRRMTDALAHRGPDGEGFFVDGFVGLGHRRLAIIDLSPGGHQPMQTADGRYTISYNGEVYNYLELRLELERMGRHFLSRTDTEVVLQAFAAWGPDAVSRLNGMFAFAVWDRDEHSLFLARDRYGIKPLYYAVAGSTVLFASEQRALVTQPEVSRAVDPAAMAEYFTFQNIFSQRTLYRDISIFPAGHWCRIRLSDAAPTLALKMYWDYDFREPEKPEAEADCTEELDRLFRQAVSRQLMSDVELGAYLSGGLDSGSITAIAAKQLPYMKSFTCGFDMHSASGLELAFDERQAAEQLSYLFRTEHYEMVLKAGDMERALPAVVRALEEPRVGQSYPNYYIARLASKFVKVVLSGTGGDELFGGYPWRYCNALGTGGFDAYVDRYFNYWQRLVPPHLFSDLLSPIAREIRDVSPRDIFRNVLQGRRDTLRSANDCVNHSLYFEARTFLHGLLVVEDKLSMAHGLENRVPFLDNDLVDFAMRLPVRSKVLQQEPAARIDENVPGSKPSQSFQRTRDGKLILRRAMARHVPSEVVERVKQGFSAPDASWFKGESIDYVRRELSPRTAPLYEIVDYNTAWQLLNDHLDGKENRRLLIWSLLCVNQWMREARGP